MEQSLEPTSVDPERVEDDVVVAGRWLVHLCTRDGALGRALTPLERTKFDDFFRLYSQNAAFKPFHIQAILTSVSGTDYARTEILLAKDTTQQLLQHEPYALQVAIKAVRIELDLLDKLFKETQPKLLNTVKLLVRHGATADSLDQNGNSALFYTCVLGYAELFQFLCDIGADIRSKHQRRTPRHISMERGQELGDCSGRPQETVNLLQVTLDALVSPEPTISSGWNGCPQLRHYDYHLWHLDLETTWGGVALDLIRGGITCASDHVGLVKLLHISCWQGAVNVMTSLINFGASLHASDKPIYDEIQRQHGSYYGSAIHAAAVHWELSAARDLIQHGADPCAALPCYSIMANIGSVSTPVGVALAAASEEENHGKAIDFCVGLLKSGKPFCDDDYVDLINFCARNDRIDVLTWLMSQSNTGKRMPQFMPETNNLDIIILLSKHGSSVDPQRMQSTAVRRHQLDTLRWSVEQHGGFLPVDPTGWRSIAWDALNCRLSDRKMLSYLVSKYPDAPPIDTVLEYSQLHKDYGEIIVKTNLLQMALDSRDVESVRVVLEAGADPACPGLPEDGLTALQRIFRSDFANFSSYLQIIRLLKGNSIPVGERWQPPPVSDSRASFKDILEKQRDLWDKRLRSLIQSRTEMPTIRSYNNTLAINVSRIDTSFNRYPYVKLTGSSSIRLLDILPAPNKQSTIEGCLVLTDITQRPAYEALSYVWGDPTMKDSMNLDNHSISITPSLHAALIHLRHPSQVRRIWVDALCINQNDVSERNQQVAIMGDIYRSAKGVVVWLGEAADNSELVFARLRFDDREEARRFTARASWGEEPATKEERQAWKSLITRPWFFRTWVIQEAVLNPEKTVIMCGDDTAPWLDPSMNLDISGGAAWLAGIRSEPEMWSAFHPISDMDPDSRIHYLQVMSIDGIDDAARVLRYSQMTGASNLKDRVYGILGLFEPGFMTVDYDLSVEEIYRQFAEANIRKRDNLTILQMNGFQRNLPTLPSWVPDFSVSLPAETFASMYVIDECNGCDEFILRYSDESTESISTIDFPMKVLPGLRFTANGALAIRGKLVDTISAIAPVLPSGTAYAPWINNKNNSDDSFPEPGTFAHVFKQWEILATTLISTWSRLLPTSVTDAFATTLVVNTDNIQEKVFRRQASHTTEFSEHAQDFTQWYRLCGTGVLEAADPSNYLRNFEFLMDWGGVEVRELEVNPKGLPYTLDEYTQALESTIYDRCFYVTEGGSMGLAAPGAKVGDSIAYIPGAYQPFVLRKKVGDDGTEASWTMHGDCYLYGLDVFALFRDDNHIVEEFVIR